MRYKIVKANFADDLEIVVKRYLNEGWLPQGGVTISTYVDEGLYTVKALFCQAIVKMEPKE